MPAPERDRRPTVVRLNDLSTIVIAVEHMLGFRPTESLVAIALCGPRERMTFSMRLDLPSQTDGDDVIGLLAGEVATRMALAKADAVMLFVHTDEPQVAGTLPHRSLVDAVEAALDAPLREAALVASDRMWSYVCHNTRCCPPEGKAIDRQSPAALTLYAEHAALGNAVLGSRDELLATMRPVGGIAAVSMRQAQARAIEAMLDAGVTDFACQVGREIDDLAERFADPRAELGDDEAARVAVALSDKRLRDHMLIALSDSQNEALRRLLATVARRAQPPDDAPICTCVGFAEYVDGSGLIAGAAFERALTTDPDYLMARYLMVALHNQVPPEEVRDCGAGIVRKAPDRLRSRRRRR